MTPKQLAKYVTEHRCMKHLSSEQRGFIHRTIIKAASNLRPSHCFTNALMLTLFGDDRVTYVEGVHDGVHHGWNKIDGVRFDVTRIINEAEMLTLCPEASARIIERNDQRSSDSCYNGKEYAFLEIAPIIFGGGMMMTAEEASDLASTEEE